ncbi:MAG: hypothetical protein HDT33_06050 [Clostridiales bacterium]|nr:hypothetical protein [Clostridiales bacterium]
MDERRLSQLTDAFLAVEGILYVSFLNMDLTGYGGDTVFVKYAGVLLCLAFALLCALGGGDRLVPIALTLTACADWFLLVRNDCYALGVALFLCVQTVYFLRLRRAGAPSLWPIRVGVVPLAGAAAFVVEQSAWHTDLFSPENLLVNLLAAVYFTQLLSNTIAAWTLKGKRWRRFALGLTLFVGCDICVGLYNVQILNLMLYFFAAVGMWLFYLPSQVLIALSALPEKEVSHEENQ